MASAAAVVVAAVTSVEPLVVVVDTGSDPAVIAESAVRPVGRVQQAGKLVIWL